MRTVMLGVFLMACTVDSARGTEYVVSTRGDDGGSGSAQQPWRTVAKANLSVMPGDTVVFEPGEYEGVVAPDRAGEEGRPITYRGAVRHGARLTGDSGTAILALGNRAYVCVEDFTVDGGGGRCWLQAANAHHLTIRGNAFRRGRRAFDMFRCEQVRLLDNVFSMDTVTGNMVQLRECSFVLVEGNSFTRVGHSPLQLTVCRNVCVRANCFRNLWGRNYEFWSSGRILVEDNLITQARDSGYSADSRAKNLYIDSIFRYNRVFGNLHTPLNSGSYMPLGAKPTASFREPFKLQNSRIYHNTIVGNLGHGWEFYGINISGNAFINNIVCGNDFTGTGVQLVVSDDISRDNRYHHNLISAAKPGAKTVQWGDTYWTTEELNEKTPTWQFWTPGYANVEGDPAFLDASRQDYRLGPGSAAIDAGRPLTLAIGDGQGRVLPVADGRVFYDGFGIEGERGDWIRVGEDGAPARVERVELRYCQAALLHLDREVTWSDGAPVSLPWTGRRPDAGAHERGCDHPGRLLALADPVEPLPGETVHFSIDPLGKRAISVHWDFADGTVFEGADARRAYSEPGHHGVIVRAAFENGEKGVAVVFVNVKAASTPDAPLVRADFEDATKSTHWGYQFKFYRRRLTGYAHEEREQGQGKCMRLFQDDGKANRVAGCIAPGAWDIDRHPFIRFAYRIPPGTPVGLCVQPFPGPNMPRRVLLGGTAKRHGKQQDGRVAADTSDYVLIDDDSWHVIALDVRQVRTVVSGLKYLRLFEFHCYWPKGSGHQFRFDDFSITAED